MSKQDHYGECEYCKHDGTSYCEDCEHLDHEYFDHWEELTPEEKAGKEKAELEKVIKAAISEYIMVDVSEDFKKAFESAKKYAAETDFRGYFMGVLMTQDGNMVASDRYSLCKIKCDHIPETLKGYIVITLEDGKVGINHEQFPDYEAVLDTTGYKSIPLEQVNKTSSTCSKETTNLLLGDILFAVDNNKLQLAKEILTGEITLYYKPGAVLNPLIFQGANGVVVVQTMRNAI